MKRDSILSSLCLTKSKISIDDDIDSKFVLNRDVELGEKTFIGNKQGTIIKANLVEMDEIIKLWGIHETIEMITQKDYDERKLSLNYPLWEGLKNTINFGEPKYFFYKQKYPLFVVFKLSDWNFEGYVVTFSTPDE